MENPDAGGTAKTAATRSRVTCSSTQGRAAENAFLDSDWLQVVEVDRRMARIARDVVAPTLVRTGVDALEVATAVIVDARAVCSWDERLQAVAFGAVKGTEPPGAASPRLACWLCNGLIAVHGTARAGPGAPCASPSSAGQQQR